MEFCVISPTAGLERYAKLSKTHLVLPTPYANDKAYREFYFRQRSMGDFIIFDNGAYEHGEPVLPEFILDEINRLNPQVLVLPDYFLQPWKKTWHAAIHFLDRYAGQFKEQQFLYIPQAEPGDLSGFIRSYQEAVSDERITWIGIPRALAYAITPDPLMRVKFAEMVLTDNPRISLHAFGMVNGDVHELPYLARLGVKSVDSSAPVWRGWHGRTCYMPEDRAWWDIHGLPVDFNAELSESLSIRYNLEACGVDTSTARG